MKRLIDKAYNAHPIIWQASVVAIIVFIMAVALIVAWQTSIFSK